MLALSVKFASLSGISPIESQRAMSATSKSRPATLKHTSCPQCGKRFEKRRTDARYCSTPCQSKAADARKNAKRQPTGNPPGRPRRASATHIAERVVRVSQPQQFCGVPAPKYASFGLRAVPRFANEKLVWKACNEVTHKVTKDGNENVSALGFAIKVEGSGHDDGWWARVGNEFAFGPTTAERAKLATEAFLRRDPLPAPKDHERYRKDDLWRIIHGR
jgi:hypothetical protein